MKIERVEVIQIETPRYYGYVSGHVLVKVHVDDGPVGLGGPRTAAAPTCPRWRQDTTIC